MSRAWKRILLVSFVVHGRSRFIIMISTYGAIIQVFVSLEKYVHPKPASCYWSQYWDTILARSGADKATKCQISAIHDGRGAIFFHGSTDKIYRRL